MVHAIRLLLPTKSPSMIVPSASSSVSAADVLATSDNNNVFAKINRFSTSCTSFCLVPVYWKIE